MPFKYILPELKYSCYSATEVGLFFVFWPYKSILEWLFQIIGLVMTLFFLLMQFNNPLQASITVNCDCTNTSFDITFRNMTMQME